MALKGDEIRMRERPRLPARHPVNLVQFPQRLQPGQRLIHRRRPRRRQGAALFVQPHGAPDLLARVGAQRIEITLARRAHRLKIYPKRWLALHLGKAYATGQHRRIDRRAGGFDVHLVAPLPGDGNPTEQKGDRGSLDLAHPFRCDHETIILDRDNVELRLPGRVQVQRRHLPSQRRRPHPRHHRRQQHHRSTHTANQDRRAQVRSLDPATNPVPGQKKRRIGALFQ